MTRLSTRLAAAAGSLLAFFALGSSPFAQAPAGAAVALIGARVLDGTGAPPLEEATVLIADGRIEAVGPAETVKIPPAAARGDHAQLVTRVLPVELANFVVQGAALAILFAGARRLVRRDQCSHGDASS